MKKLLLLSFISILMLTNCGKETITPNVVDNYNISLDEQPSLLSSELELILLSPLITDDNLGDVLIMDYPSFLNEDIFASVGVKNKNEDSCLKSLEVTKYQKEQLNKAFLARIECQKSNKAEIAKIHREFEQWANTQKKILYTQFLKTKDSLYADFKMKVAYVSEKYSKGLITLEQKQKLLNELEIKRNNDLAYLEKSYKLSLEALNKEMMEKIKTSLKKKEYSGKIKDCEKIYLESLMKILGKEKYKRWISCFKYNYRKSDMWVRVL
jgi:hypothetical protein